MNVLWLRGQPPGYRLCTPFPDNSMKENHAGEKMTHKNHAWCMIAIAFLFVLLAVVLGLYVSKLFSDPEVKWRECEDMLWNQTSQTHERLRSLRESKEAVQRDWEEAMREKDQLKVHLVAVNNSLVETKDGLDACLNQLDSLKGNLTSQVMDVEQERENHRVIKEKVEQLQQELEKKSQELDNAQRELQQERENHRAEIQKLNAERTTQDPNHSNGNSDYGPSTSLTILLLLDLAYLLAYLKP